MPTTRRWLLATVAAFASCTNRSKPPSPTVLPLAPDTLLLPNATATRAVWLGGGRWAVLAPNEGVVAVVDFTAKSVGRLGGDRDTTLRNPATIFLTGDTLYIGDWGRRRVTLWTPDGRLVRSLDVSTLVRGALPRDRDASGRFYLELAPSNGAVSGTDSGVVVRTGATPDRGDTVARLAPLDLAEVVGNQGRHLERRVFSGTDAWGALADGSVWVARVRHNRVDWRAPDGQWTKGKALPDRVLEVTRYDREMFVRNFPPELRSTAQQLPFSPLKPPFEDAFTAADGSVWLVKSRAPLDSAGRDHIVDRQGRLRRDLRVPGPGRVIGASGDAAIVVERMPTGVRLLRFSLPPLDSEVTGAH